jgi:hypothetical protein
MVSRRWISNISKRVSSGSISIDVLLFLELPVCDELVSVMLIFKRVGAKCSRGHLHQEKASLLANASES